MIVDVKRADVARAPLARVRPLPRSAEVDWTPCSGRIFPALLIVLLLAIVRDFSVWRPAKPNIVLITLGSTRADRMGFLGSKAKITPNLDGLARQSMVFERALFPGAADRGLARDHTPGHLSPDPPGQRVRRQAGCRRCLSFLTCSGQADIAPLPSWVPSHSIRRTDRLPASIADSLCTTPAFNRRRRDRAKIAWSIGRQRRSSLGPLPGSPTTPRSRSFCGCI